MRQLSLLALGGLFLLNCNCEPSVPKGEKTATTVDLLEHLPPKDLGFLVNVPSLGKSLQGFGRHVGIVLDALGSKEEGLGKLKQQLGFDPMVPAELEKAGIRADGGFVIWGGAPTADEDWRPHIAFEVSEPKALVETVTALAKREAALQVDPVTDLPEGKWYGLFRTFGKKKEAQGGLLVRDKPPIAILTGVDLPSLQAFLKVKGSVNDHPEWVRFAKRSKEPSDVTILITTLGLGRAMGQQVSAASLKVMPYLIKLGFETKRFWVGNHQIMDSETLATTQRLQPEPPVVVGPPKGTILAGSGSLDLGQTYKQLERNPLVAAQLRKLDPAQREGLTGSMNQVFGDLGSTFRLFLGAKGEPGGSPWVLVGQAFFGLDILGRDPTALKKLLPQLAIAAGLPPGQMAPTAKGYSLQISKGVPPLDIELDAAEKRLSMRFGNPPSQLEPLSGAKAQVTLPKGTLSSFYLDLTRLGKALIAVSALRPTTRSTMETAARILSSWSYLLVDQRLDKNYHVQTLQIVLP